MWWESERREWQPGSGHVLLTAGYDCLLKVRGAAHFGGKRGAKDEQAGSGLAIPGNCWLQLLAYVDHATARANGMGGLGLRSCPTPKP